jgi:hypothetical protein
MKINSKLISFLLASIFFVFSLASADEVVNISQSPGWTSNYPRVAVDSDGGIHVIWVEEYSSSSGDVFYAYCDPVSNEWSQPKNLSNNNKVYCDTQMACGIAVDDSDNVYAVWAQRNDIRMRVFSGGSWNNAITVASSGVEVDCPRVAASDNGNVFVIWWTLDGNVYSKARVNGSWESAKRISQAGKRSKFPDIAAGNNLVYACWVEKNGEYQAAYSKRNKSFNASWSPRNKIYTGSDGHQHAVVELDSYDYPHVVWTTYKDGPRVVTYSHWTGSNFSSPEEISETLLLHYPSLAERDNNLYACWQIGAYGNGMGVHYNTRQNEDWSGESSVPNSGGVTFCDVAAEPDGETVYFVWDARGEIYFYGGDTVPSVNIPPVAKFNFSPQTGLFPLEVSFDGSASYDPDGSIVRYEWDFGDGGVGSGKKINYIYQTWGTFPITLSVVDNKGAVGTQVKSIEILRLFQPLNIRYETFIDESLFFLRHVTEIYWERNPKNDDIAEIVLYRIYKKLLGESNVAYRCIGEVNADVFNFRDTDVEEDVIYVYTVTSIDGQGHESPIVESTGGATLNNKSDKKEISKERR